MRVLDTNVVIALLSGRTPITRQKFRTHMSTGRPIVLPIIALFELRYGIEKSARPEANAAALNEFLGQGLHILAFSEDDAHGAAIIRSSLEAKGLPIGPYDILIAAQALTRSATLVTANTREFQRIDGLAVEDWTADS
jgi:tRNA(fMet)-specific endonuclease VapC